MVLPRFMPVAARYSWRIGCQMHPVTDQHLTTVVFDLGAVLIDWDPRYVNGTCSRVTRPAWSHSSRR